VTEDREVGYRPWGMYEVLHTDDHCKVKKITVKPRQKLSLQSHKHRRETWIILFGVALFQRGDDHISKAVAGEHIVIEKEEKHRIENTGEEDLVFIEVQTGESFDESDIVRYEDSYGRV
jgi:mannose-6-phosphate isomerase-like protein (cupin superfamily)